MGPSLKKWLMKAKQYEETEAPKPQPKDGDDDDDMIISQAVPMALKPKKTKMKGY